MRVASSLALVAALASSACAFMPAVPAARNGGTSIDRTTTTHATSTVSNPVGLGLRLPLSQSLIDTNPATTTLITPIKHHLSPDRTPTDVIMRAEGSTSRKAFVQQTFGAFRVLLLMMMPA
jgi:hypothetical protein